MGFRLLTAVALVIASTSSGIAGFVQVTYSDYVASKTSAFQRIAASFDLSGKERNAAIQMAAEYQFFGPCRGRIIKGIEIDFPGAFSIQSYGVENKFTQAVKVMLFEFAADTIGRLPSRYACQYAGELAFRPSPAGADWEYCHSDMLGSDGTSLVCRRHSDD